MCYFLLFESSYKISNILYPLMQREKFYFTGTHLSAVRLPFREKLIGVKGEFRIFPYVCQAKLLQKSEMRKNMVMDLIYRGFIYAANYSESHYNPRRSQIKTELRYLFVTTLNR